MLEPTLGPVSLQFTTCPARASKTLEYGTYVMTPHRKFDEEYAIRVHDIVFPGDVRENDRIAARLRLRGSDSEYEKVRVWRMSPFGIELMQSETGTRWCRGDKLDMEIAIGGERRKFEGLVVDEIERSKKIALFGIRFLVDDEVSNQLSDTDRRGSIRWICAEDYLPVAVAPAPGLFNEFLRFQVRNMSREGLELYTSLRNKFLIRGMSLRLSVTFPLVGDAILLVTVVRIDIRSQGGKEVLSIGVELVNPNPSAREVMAQYLVQFSNIESLDQLRDQGFRPKSVSRGVNFAYVKSLSDYQSMLDLRFRCSGTSSGNPMNEGEVADQDGRLAVAKLQDRVIATARIGFPNSRQTLELEENLEIATKLPRKDEILEISKICVEPAFVRSDLLAGLFRFICATCMSASRPYVLVTARQDSVDFYRRLGWKPLSDSQDKDDDVVLIGNAFDAMTGRGANPIYWNYVWRDVSDYMLQNSDFQPTGVSKVMLAIYRAFGPFSRLYFFIRSYLLRD